VSITCEISYIFLRHEQFTIRNMSKRVRVPAPFGRLQPSVIRTFGPRLLLFVSGCAILLLVVSGGSYVLSHVGSKPATTPQTKAPTKLPDTTAPDAQVLGTATDTPAAGDTSTSSTSTQATAADDATTPSPSTSASTAASSPTVNPVPGAAQAIQQTTAPVQAAVQTLLSPLQQLLSLP